MNSRVLSLLKSTFGQIAMSSDNINVAVVCPNKMCTSHTKGTKKLSINIETGVYHCWVCELKGRSVLRLFKKYHPGKMSQAAVLFKSSNRITDLDDVQPKQEKEEIKLPKNFILLSSRWKFSKDPDVLSVVNYCKKRGLSSRDAERYRLGTTHSGQHRRRIVIPSFDSRGRLNYLTSRTIDPNKKNKYINFGGRSSSIIFNEIDIDWSREIMIVEGPFDLFKSSENTTCLLGSSFSEKTLLFQNIVKNETPVVLALDPDASSKTHSYARKLSRHGIQVRILDLGKFADVGEMTKDESTKRRAFASSWRETDFLMNKLSKIKYSGSFSMTRKHI